MNITRLDNHTLKTYLWYKLFSAHRKGHGIHSPFVFNLISEVFRNKTTSGIVLDLENVRKIMLSDSRVISVTDLGSGSKYKKGNLRQISEIAQHSAVPPKYGILLLNLAAEFGGTDIIELGTSLGISAMYLARGSSSATVHTVEGCPETADLAASYFRQAGFTNIVRYTTSFDNAICEFRERQINPGLVFIDGDHRRDSVLRYFRALADIRNYKTVIVIDDIHCSKEMGEAWDSIMNDPSVTLTIDIFRMGLVFFRDGLTPLDYIIRY